MCSMDTDILERIAAISLVQFAILSLNVGGRQRGGVGPGPKLE